MTVPYNIPIEIPVNMDASVMTIAELKEKIQAYVNSLFVQVNTNQKCKPETNHSTLAQQLHGTSKITTDDMKEDIDFIRSLHAEGGRGVPADEDPMYALFEEKYK